MKYGFSSLLQKKIKKMATRNKPLAIVLKKKMQEVIQSDSNSIEHYKNLKFPMHKQKRVHIDSSFVLTFEFDKQKNLITFLDFDHHNKIYKRK